MHSLESCDYTLTQWLHAVRTISRPDGTDCVPTSLAPNRRRQEPPHQEGWTISVASPRQIGGRLIAAHFSAGMCRTSFDNSATDVLTDYSVKGSIAHLVEARPCREPGNRRSITCTKGNNTSAPKLPFHEVLVLSSQMHFNFMAAHMQSADGDRQLHPIPYTLNLPVPTTRA